MLYSTLVVLLCGGILFSVDSQKPSVTSLSLIKEQISEVMIVCDGRPTSCLCANGMTLPGEFFFPGIFSCSPSTCLCPNGISVKNLNTIEVDDDITPERFRRMMSLGSYMGVWSRIEKKFETFCEGQPPTSCSCQNGDEITSFHKKTNALITCRPSLCQCPNGSSKDVPDNMRHSFLSQLDNICNVKECECSSNASTIIPPFESLSVFEKCSPKTCSCLDGSQKDLPSLPSMEENLIQSIDDLSKKRLRSFSTLCDGKSPDFCDCLKRTDVISSFGDEKELRSCYPSNCTCLDGSNKRAPKRRGTFNRIIRDMDLKYGKEETNKLINFYRGRKYSKYNPKDEDSKK